MHHRPGLVVAMAMVVALAGCSGGGSSSSTGTTTPPPQITAVALGGASSLAPLPGGGFLAGERATGRVREVTPAGAVRPDAVVTVPVSSTGAQGLVGIAVDGAGRVFAAWTTPAAPNPEGGRLIVGQIFPGAARTIWVGPTSAEQHLGGHLVLAPDGRLVVGVGDLGDARKMADPTAANGKLLSIDPDAAPTQAPVVISSGWNDPESFSYTPDGRLWVVDRTGPGGRLARGDQGGRPSDVAPLTGTAVGGLAALSTDELVVCAGSASGRLERRLVSKSGPATIPTAKRLLASGCVLGVTRLIDGRIAAAEAETVHLITP